MEKNNEKITTICISTCNRPEQLRSSLSGLINHLEKYNRSPRILIVDDSEDIQSAQQSREIISSYFPKYKGEIEFMDRNDRKNMASKIAEEKNIPEETMNFALCGDKVSPTTAGSSQNTFLLKTRGEKILMIDDDVVYRFFSPIKKEELPFFSIENPNEYWFLKDKETPPTSLFKTVEVDLLSAHENMLGKKASEILGEDTPDYIKDLEIIDTYMGAYGDSPMESHIPLLLLPQVQKKLKNISLEEYKIIKETRRIIQTPLSPTVYQGTMCISMVMGVDNRGPIPPFLPNGRGQDLVFGTTRYTAFPSKLSAYIPLLIEHKRPGKEARPVAYDSVYEFTKMTRVIASLISEIDDIEIEPHENLKKVGGKFISIAKEPAPSFYLIMEAQCQKITKLIINHVNTVMENSSEMPDFCINDMRSIISTLNSPDPKFFMADITKNHREDKMVILQKWMNLYGQLLQEWHKLLSK